MTTKSVIINALALCLVVFALSGCSSEVLTEEHEVATAHEISLQMEVGFLAETITNTRGGSINDISAVSSIGLFALSYPATQSYTSATPGDFIYNAEVVETDGKWKTGYSWPGTNRKTAFFAYAPYNASTITPSAGSQYGNPVLTYTVPNNAADQRDLLVGGVFDVVKQPSDRTAQPIVLDHALARIVVYSGEMNMPAGQYASIQFDEIHKTGELTMGISPVWTTNTGNIGMVEATDITYNGTAGDVITPDAKVFMMIPQTLPNTAEIVVRNTNGKTYRQSIYPSAAHPDYPTVWAAGETYVYQIDTNQHELGYTGGIQEWTAPKSGTYKLEVWGAQGGDCNGRGYQVGGGYSYGNVELEAGDVLFVCVGGKGGNNSGRTAGAGGYNGGGKGGNCGTYSTGEPWGGGGGGGATHIATKTGVLSSLSGDRSAILLVAGGAGGNTYYAAGGAGGGESGCNSANMNGRNVVAGATQTTGYAFGQGQAGRDKTIWGNGGPVGCGGGGGGYMGGIAYQGQGTDSEAGGSGGSGYIGGVISGTGATFDGTQTFDAPLGGTETGHLGNGAVRITYLP